METHNRKRRIEAKRRDAIESAIATIRAISEGRVDAYEGWQQVCNIFQSNVGGGLPELKPFVQIEGVSPYDTLSVTKELREKIRQNAVTFLSSC